MNRPAFAELRDALPALRKKYAAHPDVTVVGIGHKYTKGALQDDYSLVFGVAEKGNPQGALLPGKVQTAFGTVPTDVLTSSPANRMFCNGHIDGADFLAIVGTSRFGTLGAVLQSAHDDTLYALTNSHVLAAPGMQVVGAPVTSRMFGSTFEIGQVAFHSSLDAAVGSHMDVGLVRLSAEGADIARAYRIQPLSDSWIEKSGYLSAAKSAGAARPHFYAPFSTGHLLNGCHMPVEIDSGEFHDEAVGVDIRLGRHFRLEMTHGTPSSGHSGSVLLRRSTKDQRHLILAGLIFAGRGRELFAFSWPDVARYLAKNGFEFR